MVKDWEGTKMVALGTVSKLSVNKLIGSSSFL